MALPGVLVGLGAAGCVGRHGEQLVRMLEGVRTSRKVGNQWSRGRPHFLLFSLHRRDTDDAVTNDDLLWLLSVIMKVLAVLGVGKKLFLLLNIF